MTVDPAEEVADTGGRPAPLRRAEHRAGVHVRVEPPTRFERLLYGFVRGALVGFARLWLRVEYAGLEQVPTDRPFVLAPVHRSNIDFLLASGCTRRRQRFLGKDTLWKPGFGPLWSALGGIPVARGTADREALRACQAVVEGGEPLVMFPEGTRQEGPEVQELFDGPAFVQARTGAPIVPVGIGGSQRAMPKGARFVRPAKVVVVIGEPLEAPEAEGAKARRTAVRTQTALLHERLQTLFDEAQKRAGTPNRR
ncbi:lysophospholipid acyltransferase family protein [Iamia majanohamensis]|uniref:Lysophospholipid acyltransferase family protein n=1 Tax=Iamia majanohamensis TaxID=467976 RepID=A0AAE9YJ95_9ACTN|nr:lysophospholipid acyltransferase family protein [Iamia majanohamensis]WCO69146.1 lysophospholipid acyltransferase family protein [Iamia majanohamensis]